VYVQQLIQTQTGIIQDIPKNVLAGLVIGQRVDAIVISPATAAEMMSIKVGDTLLDIRSLVAMQAGQKIQLELMIENGKPVLKLVPASTPSAPAEIPSLKPGLQVAVEVVKVLAENKVLVQTAQLHNNTNQASLAQKNVNQAPLTQQNIEVDVSQLAQRYKVGDKLLMDVVSVKPLSVQLRPEQALPREQVILDKIRQLLPQQVVSPTLNKVMASLHNQQLPEPIQKAVQQLIHHSIDKTELTNPQALKQAVSASGVIMERQLLNQPNQSTQDFKANLLNVLKAVETVIADNKGLVADKGINRLPAQVQAALTANGRTPAQLINVLLSGKSVPSILSSLTTQTNIPSIINQQQAVSLLALLNKPLIPTQQAINRHVPMDLIELMQLFKEVETVHNKIQLNQLNMLKEPESGTTVASWLFDLPIKDKQALDLLQVQIDQHKQQSEEDQENEIWNVRLRLDTQNLGPVQATVTLVEQDVKVIIKAERQESAQLLDDNLTILHEALAELGISISHSSCSCGAVDKAVNINSDNKQLSASLLDVSV